MGELKVRIPNNIENQLKSTAIECFGNKRDAIDIAVSKAVEEWLDKMHKIVISHEPPQDPVEAIWGMLSHVDKSSVELQHEAKKIRFNKAMRYRRDCRIIPLISSIFSEFFRKIRIIHQKSLFSHDFLQYSLIFPTSYLLLSTFLDSIRCQ